jgi:hypothetical protein
MPAMSSAGRSTIADEDHSLWVLKIGVGGLVRTVKVAVDVQRWAGPEDVDFTFKLQGDPVEGSGSYRAKAVDDAHTEVTLAVQVRGSGPMAPMWEAMGAPVLPHFARSFAEELRDRIEALAGTAAGTAAGVVEPAPSMVSRMLAWLRHLFRSR